MFKWGFLKKIINVFFCDEIILLDGAAILLTATNNKEFTGKSSLTSFCAHHISQTESVMKEMIAQNNLQVSEGGITVKSGQDSIHELLI